MNIGINHLGEIKGKRGTRINIKIERSIIYLPWYPQEHIVHMLSILYTCPKSFLITVNVERFVGLNFHRVKSTQ